MAQYWKRHVCIGCGSAFRYTFARLKTAPRANPGPRKRPCPTCGLYQPDMIGKPRLWWHFLIGVIGVIATLTFAGLGADLALSDRVTMWGAAGFGALTILGHMIVVLWHPNRHPQANRERAKRLLKSGEMELLRGETPDKAARRLPRWGFAPVHAFALGGLIVGIVMFVAGDLVRLAYGWPMNPGCRPGVMGPGDESRIYFDEDFTSVKGLWNGAANAWILNFTDLGLTSARLEATTQHNAWGDTILIRDEKVKQGVTPWVAVRVPDSSRLCGKQLQVKVDLLATFPAFQGGHFENAQQAFTQTTSLQVATKPGAGKLYATLWHFGGFAGTACLGLMSLVFVIAAWNLRRRALPLKVVHDEEDEMDDEDTDDDEEDYRRPRRRHRDG